MFSTYDVTTYVPERPEGKGVLVVPTDSEALNDALNGGISTGEFYLIPSASGVGKTTILQRLTLRTLIEGYDAAFISLGEQKPETLYEGLMCMNRKKRYANYRHASNEERREFYDKVMESKFGKELRYKLHYYYTNDVTTKDIKEIFSDIKEKGIRFVFIDYIGSNTPEGEAGRNALKKFCEMLACTADEENICIVSPIQTNRKYDEEESKGELVPQNINASYVADSMNTVRKATVGMSFIRIRGTNEAYFNVFKGRFIDNKLVKIYIEPYSYRWSDEPLLPFEEI